MTVFALKKYQTATLDVLRTYLEAARIVGAKPLSKTSTRQACATPRPYRPLEGLETVPYVCLRLPTGGGKTLLSAHTAKIAADAYLEREFPDSALACTNQHYSHADARNPPKSQTTPITKRSVPPSTGAFACSTLPISFK